MALKTYILFSLAAFFAIACNDDKKTEEPESTEQEENEKTYQLVWQDEFYANGKPNSAKWVHEHGFIRNQEAQYYTDSLKNARVENSHLILETHKEQIANTAFTSTEAKKGKENQEFGEYTSASVTTNSITEWTYGKIEVSAKLPKGKGIWPAIWMLSENWEEVGWPKSGEIDIMEHVGLKKIRFTGPYTPRPIIT